MVNVVCRMAFVVGPADLGSTPTEVEGEGEEGKRVKHTCTYIRTFIYVCSTQWSPEVYSKYTHTGQNRKLSNGGCEFQGVPPLLQTPVKSPPQATRTAIYRMGITDNLYMPIILLQQHSKPGTGHTF